MMATKNSIASNIPIEISKGGTNATSFATNYGVIYYDGSKLATVASAGTSGQALTSNGAGVAPSFQNFTGGGGASVSGFLATLNSTLTNYIGDNFYRSIKCDTEIFDSAGEYDPSTGAFTASITGKYAFTTSAALFLNGGIGYYEIGISVSNRDNYLLGTSFGSGNGEGAPSSTGFDKYTGKCMSLFVDMDAADVGIGAARCSTGSNNVSIIGNAALTFFSGYLVG